MRRSREPGFVRSRMYYIQYSWRNVDINSITMICRLNVGRPVFPLKYGVFSWDWQKHIFSKRLVKIISVINLPSHETYEANLCIRDEASTHYWVYKITYAILTTWDAQFSHIRRVNITISRTMRARYFLSLRNVCLKNVYFTLKKTSRKLKILRLQYANETNGFF